ADPTPAYADELASAIGFGPVKSGDHRLTPEFWNLHSKFSVQKWQTHENKGDECTDWVARQADEVLSSDLTVREGFAGLHRNLPQCDMSHGLYSGTDMVFFAYRDPTTSNDDISFFTGLRESVSGCLSGIFNDTWIQNFAANLPQQCL